MIVYFDQELGYQDDLVPTIDRLNAEQHLIPLMDNRLHVISVQRWIEAAGGRVTSAASAAETLTLVDQPSTLGCDSTLSRFFTLPFPRFLSPQTQILSAILA